MSVGAGEEEEEDHLPVVEVRRVVDRLVFD
jgi:hypothetical protein